MEINRFIDHTVLRVDCDREQVQKICSEAIKNHFFAVCVPSYYVREAFLLLENTPVKVATVVGFPMGYVTTPAKVEETKRAIDDGADEVDMVVNISAIKDKSWTYVKNDIESVTRTAHLRSKLVKVILEVCLLTKEEIEKLCEICTELEVNFVKTSTGFNGPGATVDNVAHLRSLLPPSIKIKASGGIKTAAQAIQLLEAGADRIGTSSAMDMVID